MNIARIDPGTNTVVNIEIADAEWLAAARDNDPGHLLVPYDDTNPAHIGWGYDPDSGEFEQPPMPPPVIYPPRESTNV